MGFAKAHRAVLDELASTLGLVREEQAEDLCRLLRRARAVFVTGEGRSGLVGRCFAMRLMHLGLTASVVGETTTPRLGAGDALVAVSGTGETAITCAIARLAAEAGGTVAAVTSAPESSLARMAAHTLAIPAPPGAAGRSSAQYGGSLFEQAAFIALEVIVALLCSQLGRTAEDMDSRHTNLE